MLNAQNGQLEFADGRMDYIRFGRGKRVLIMLPGLGDGLRTVKGSALPMALLYRGYTAQYTVYAFSRISGREECGTTRDMARDVKQAMDSLGIEKADVLGVSMGGMIAQFLAIDYPQRVDRLVLAVTAARPNPILAGSLEEWLDCARRDDPVAFMESSIRRIYSPGYYRRNKWLTPIVGKLTRPASWQRYCQLSAACGQHDAFSLLGEIRAKTLVIGGGQDMALGVEASRELAREIPDSELLIYEQWGHGLYEEARDFDRKVLEFLCRSR